MYRRARFLMKKMYLCSINGKYAYIMDNLNLGLQLLVVGMSTVFVILLIVIYGGKLLINVVNRLAPEEMQASVKKVPRAVGGMPDASTMAILNEVVRQLTGGKGHVERARKI